MIGKPRPVLPTCAICADEIKRDPPLQDAVGKDGALVNVCEGCATEAPRSYNATRGYEVPDGSIMMSKALQKSSTAASPAHAVDSVRGMFHATLARVPTPGMIVLRVNRLGPDGKPRDRRVARRCLSKAHRDGARYLGTTPDFFLFEAPDAAMLAKARTPEVDVLDELADLARPAAERARRPRKARP